MLFLMRTAGFGVPTSFTRRQKATPGALLLGGLLVTAVATRAFVPCTGALTSVESGARRFRSHARLASASASELEEYLPYEWQILPDSSKASPGIVGETTPRSDFDDSSNAEEGSLKTQVQMKQLDMTGFEDEVRPPDIDFGQAVAIWAVFLFVVAGVAAFFSWAQTELQANPAMAGDILRVAKPGFTVVEILFGMRILLAQFGVKNTTDLPWAIFHYPTEWILAPTRTVVKPEAGIDMTPVLWLFIVALLAELIAGSNGFLNMARDSAAIKFGGTIDIRK
eukprot:TRINITY_DN2135_c0_g1_i1.p1 TRINITY_DN2135_c0_g1~~TRINITY_DN2135_c0_g1_i1.p1  ORF type:complete len:281 (+),score=57.72 TRINITY_DN2135_c0_g1_i1:30-872(+)